VKYLLFYEHLLVSVVCAEQTALPYVSVVVSDVTTYRIEKYIVRIIEYNTR